MEPIGYVVLRHRGGWNVPAELALYTESRAEAVMAVHLPETAGFDPPADEHDLFTYHPVMPCPEGFRHLRALK